MIRSQNPEKERVWTVEIRVFLKALRNFNSTDQILKRNWYISNKTWRATLFVFYITLCHRVGHNCWSAQLPLALHPSSLSGKVLGAPQWQLPEEAAQAPRLLRTRLLPGKTLETGVLLAWLPPSNLRYSSRNPSHQILFLLQNSSHCGPVSQ